MELMKSVSPKQKRSQDFNNKWNIELNLFNVPGGMKVT